MGMFDYVRVKFPLPEADRHLQEKLFQTKDTPDQYMTEYVIEEDGRLTWQPYHYEEVPVEERPYPNDTGFKSLWGSMRRINDGDREDVPYHGDISFYDYWMEGEGEDRKLVGYEFIARFTEDRCVRIWKVEERS